MDRIRSASWLPAAEGGVLVLAGLSLADKDALHGGTNSGGVRGSRSDGQIELLAEKKRDAQSRAIIWVWLGYSRCGCP